MSELQKAAQLKNELDKLRPLSPEDEARIMQKFRLDWNFHSNHLEGNSLTYGETKALILFGITAQGKPLKDHFEITGHDEAVKWVSEIIKEDRPLTEIFIREIHELVLKEKYTVRRLNDAGLPTAVTITPGDYKEIENHVETSTGETFYFATPAETPAMMNDLVGWFRAETEKENKNPVILASEFHYKFIRIHPFPDGNGRTARILMNFILMSKGYPPVVIKTEDKENYFAVLRQADAGLFEPFTEYIAENLNRSLDIMIRGAKGESIEEPDDIEKEIALLEQKLFTNKESFDVAKDYKSIESIIQNSIEPLALAFVKKGKLFENFYIKSEVKFLVSGFVSANAKTFNDLRKSINSSTDVITFIYSYDTLKQKNLLEFSFDLRLQIFCETATWIIYNSTGESFIEKKYNEQITEEEIDKIINAEIRLHTKAIEKAIS